MTTIVETKAIVETQTVVNIRLIGDWGIVDSVFIRSSLSLEDAYNLLHDLLQHHSIKWRTFSLPEKNELQIDVWHKANRSKFNQIKRAVR